MTWTGEEESNLVDPTGGLGLGRSQSEPSGMPMNDQAAAETAAMYAQVAAKNASALANYVQYLWHQIGTLNSKVTELEEWKKKTLQEVKTLREEQKRLRNKLGEAAPSQPSLERANTVPVSLAEHVVPSPTSGSVPVPAPSLERAKSQPEAARNQESKTEADLEAKSGAHLPPAPPGLEEMSFKKEDADGKDLKKDSELDDDRDASTLSGISSMWSPGDYDAALSKEGVKVERSTDELYECAEWKIAHLSKKLKECMGRALVSSSFKAWGFEDLRLMVCPDGKETTKGPRSRRQKQLYNSKVSDGPLEGCLKLKVPQSVKLEYMLKIGDETKGPFQHNFEESIVTVWTELGIDFLKKVDADQSLTVSVLIKDPKHTMWSDVKAVPGESVGRVDPTTDDDAKPSAA